MNSMGGGNPILFIYFRGRSQITLTLSAATAIVCGLFGFARRARAPCVIAQIFPGAAMVREPRSNESIVSIAGPAGAYTFGMSVVAPRRFGHWFPCLGVQLLHRVLGMCECEHNTPTTPKVQRGQRQKLEGWPTVPKLPSEAMFATLVPAKVYYFR